MQGLAGDDFADAALEGESAVATAAPGGGAAALGAQVLQLAVAIAQLAVEKAAPIPQELVVTAELIAVIAQGQQGRPAHKAAVGGLEMGIADRGAIQAQLVEKVVVAKAQLGGGESGGIHLIPVIAPQPLDAGFKRQGQQGVGGGAAGHGAGWALPITANLGVGPADQLSPGSGNGSADAGAADVEYICHRADLIHGGNQLVGAEQLDP